MATLQKMIANRIKSLSDLSGVVVSVEKDLKSITVKYKTVYSLDFKFDWLGDHYVGYVLDKDNIKSHAFVSIYDPMEAIQFVTVYSILLDIRADRRS